MNARNQLAIALAAGCIIILIALAILGQAQPATAGAVPTPISNVNPSSDWLAVTFWANRTATGSGASPALMLPAYEYLNLHWIYDQIGSPPNTTTLKIQYSNDAVFWAEGPTIVTNQAADDNAIVQVPILARYVRAYATTSNSSALAITITAIAK